MKSTIGIDSHLENWRIGERTPFSFNCMACKVKGKASNICKFKDPLTPILEEIAQDDGLVLGSPIYFGDVTGQMRTFLERLCFPWLSYNDYSLTALNWPHFRNRPSNNGVFYIGKLTFRRPMMLDGEWLAIRRLLFDKS